MWRVANCWCKFCIHSKLESHDLVYKNHWVPPVSRLHNENENFYATMGQPPGTLEWSTSKLFQPFLEKPCQLGQGVEFSRAWMPLYKGRVGDHPWVHPVFFPQNPSMNVSSWTDQWLDSLLDWHVQKTVLGFLGQTWSNVALQVTRKHHMHTWVLHSPVCSEWRPLQETSKKGWNEITWKSHLCPLVGHEKWFLKNGYDSGA